MMGVGGEGKGGRGGERVVQPHWHALQGEAGSQPSQGERQGTRIHPLIVCQLAWASCLTSPFPESKPVPKEACHRTLGRHGGRMTKEKLGETDTDIAKGNRNSRTREE